MKIIHVIDSMEIGGAEMLVAQLCRWQRREGHAPAVLCLLEAGALAKQLEREGIPIRVHGPLSGYPSKLKFMSELYRIFRQERPDVVHCHNVSPTVLAAPSARWAGVRAVISTRHGLAIPYFHRSEVEGATDSAGAFVRFSLAAAFCNYVVAVCDAARRNLQVGPCPFFYKVVTIRNGTLPLSVSPVPDPSIRKEGFTLINVARLHRIKDHACLLRAVALARQQVTDLFLWLVGDGGEADALRQLARQLKIEDCVRFAGERRDVGDWLAQADLFVLSSLTEGVPISLLEAMAAGLPFLVTNVGGMPEIAEVSGAGTTVEPNRPEALAEAMVQLARRRADLPELGRRARECYKQHFTPDFMFVSYSRLYQECLKKGA